MVNGSSEYNRSTDFGNQFAKFDKRMGRTAVVSIWHSRVRLSICSIILAYLTVLLYIFDNEDFNEETLQKDKQTSFQKDFIYALEALNYMHDLQRGRAKIRPVVEEQKQVNVSWRCGLHWPTQWLNTSWLSANNMYIFSATYDRRRNSLYPSNHALQVLVTSFTPITKKCFCNIYSAADKMSVVVEATVREIWQRAWDPRSFFYIPNLITCPLPDYFKDKERLGVAIVHKACTSSNDAIWVRKNTVPNSKKNGVAVCVKGLDFLDDISVRLVEWIEAQYLFGADHITMYVYYVPQKAWRVLNYYMKKGKLTTIPLTLPGDSPNHIFTRSRFIWRNRQQKRRHELIPYNDCFYRHIDTHDYILIVDTDELVVPLQSDNWVDMLKLIAMDEIRRSIISISIRNVFKFPSNFSDESIPKYMFMLRNKRMSKLFSKPGEYGKSFTNTDTAASVFNHFALHRLHGNVSKTIYAKPDVALKLHYKLNCPIESRRKCLRYHSKTIRDVSLDRFSEELMRRVSSVVKVLKLL